MEEEMWNSSIKTLDAAKQVNIDYFEMLRIF